MPLFTYQWVQDVETSAEIDENSLSAAGETIDTIIQNIRNQTEANAATLFKQVAGDEGMDARNVVASVNISYDYRTEYRGWPFPQPVRVYRLLGTVEYRFDSSDPLMGSPVATTLVLVIKLVLEAIVLTLIAYFAIQAVKQWLQSMTTTSRIVRKIDPVTGEIIEEETVTPSSTGILTIILGATAAVLIVGAAASLALSRRRT